MTSPTAIPSPRPPLTSLASIPLPGLTKQQRTRIALDVARGLMERRCEPQNIVRYLQHASPWVETGVTS